MINMNVATRVSNALFRVGSLMLGSGPDKGDNGYNEHKTGKSAKDRVHCTTSVWVWLQSGFNDAVLDLFKVFHCSNFLSFF